MTNDQIKYMTQRFLGWRLPETFNPDNGIAFNPPEEGRFRASQWPVGTNLFDAAQAEGMVRHMAYGLPATPAVAPPEAAADATSFSWLIEAPGQNYLGARRLGRSEFYWTPDHAKALRFWSKEQADQTMMAVREATPALFAFAANLGDARPRQHCWLTPINSKDTSQ